MSSGVKCLTCISSYNTVDGAHVLSPFYSFLIRKLKNREVIICPRPLGHQGEEPRRSPCFWVSACASLTHAAQQVCSWLVARAPSSGRQKVCRQQTHASDIVNLPTNTNALARQHSPHTLWWLFTHHHGMVSPRSMTRACICVDGYCSLSIQLWDRNAVAWFTGLGSLCPPPTCNLLYFRITHIVRDLNLFIFQETWFNFCKFKCWTYFLSEYIILKYLFFVFLRYF